MADKLTPSDVKGLFEKLSNWGRWGKEDQRGALNFITNQKRAARRAAGADRRERFDGAAARDDSRAPTIPLPSPI